MIQHYRDLIAWQKAKQVVTDVYKITKQFPDDEKFGLTSQLRRAAVSIPSNIAEGQARNSTGEFKQFLGISQGSLAESATQLIIAENLGYIKSANNILLQAEEVSRINSGLMKSLKTR